MARPRQDFAFQSGPLISIISIALSLSVTIANISICHALSFSYYLGRSPQLTKLSAKPHIKNTQVEIPTIASVSSATGRTTFSHAFEDRKHREYCSGCHRPFVQCLCDHLPPKKISLSTKVLILQHPVEFRRKTISTVPLVRLALEHVQILVGRSFDHQLDSILQAAIFEGTMPLLLFPGANSTTLEDPMALSKLDQRRQEHMQKNGVDQLSNPNMDENKFLLIIVDGTWTQARKMVRCSPILMERCQPIQFTSTSAEDRSIYGSIREQPDSHCLSTLESCSRTLSLLEPNNPNIHETTDYLHTLLKALVYTQIEQERINLAKQPSIRNLEKIKLKQKRQRELGLDLNLQPAENKSQEKKKHLEHKQSNDMELGETKIEIETALGDSFLLRSLIPSDSVFVDSRWPYRSKKSLKMIESQIRADNSNATQSGCSCCLGIDHDGRLVACILRHRNGSLGILHVDETYRRRGLGKILLSEATSSVQRRGELPIAFIVDGNTHSEALFSTLGWSKENPLAKKGTGKRKAKRKWVLYADNDGDRCAS